jgi:peptidoglycan/xylan/chitin deacetylase (PgdA/CDA1 family)
MIFFLMGCSNNSDLLTEEVNEVDVHIEKDDIETTNEIEKNEIIEEVYMPPNIDYKEVKPNELGHIMVVMYHGIMDLPPYHRTPEDFRKDLMYMYENGYRPISMRDYIDQNIDLEPGLTPIVLTFDDGLSSTFSLVYEKGDLVPAPNTAVAIMEAFSKEFPDFGKAAAFYINSDLKVFEGEGTVEERLKWLVDNGYDVANHTSQHAKLSTLDEEAVQEHIGRTDQLIKESIGNDYIVDSLSYPFGVRPKEGLLQFVLEGTYEHHAYVNKIALKEGPSGPFVPPYHMKFDNLLVPRVRGSEGDIQDLWWFFEYYENNSHLRYISDGNKERVSVPKSLEHLINFDVILDKEVYTYEINE